MTSSMPASRAASMRPVCTCDTNPSVRIDARSGSRFIAVTVSIGLALVLLRSKITSAGRSARAWSRISGGVRANVSSTPACFAVVRILELKSRSSTAARIMER